jgi:hypothetical protein
MTVIRRSRLWRTLTWLLVLAFLGTVTPFVVAPVRADPVPPRTILVLPVSNQSGQGDPHLAGWVSDELVLGLTGKPGLAGVDYTATDPVVRRAISEGHVLPAQIETPPQTPADAVALGHALQVDAVLQVTIDSLVLTEYPKQAKVSLSGGLYSVAANFNAQTGEATATPTAERSFKVVGASAPVAQYSGADGPLIREAIRGAVAQICAAVAGEQPGPARVKSHHSNAWIAVVLAIGLLGVLIANTHNSSHAPAGAFPPVPVSQNVEAGGIQLTWNPPAAGGLTLLKYEIKRQIDGQPAQFIDNGLVGAGQTTHFDNVSTILTPGTHRLSYQIAAVYTNQAVSPFATFSTVSFPN